MNKKRFLIFISLILCIAAIITVILIVKKKQEPAVSLLTANEEDEVSQFYYRAVPGLKMAEQAGLVRSVDKRMELPGREAALNIDRIWYSNKQVIIFYHIEGISQVVYLGGNIYLPSSEPVEKTPFHGTASIGSPNEKGILYKNSFYSCLKLPLLHDNSGRPLDEVEVLSYTPFLTISGQKENESPQIIQMKSINIPIGYRTENETVVKIPIDSRIELDPERIYFYQVDVAPSVTRIYFQFLNSNRDRVNRVKGSYTTDKGETYDFDAYTTVITDFPYHYYIEIPPFHIMPDNLQLKVNSLYLTGGDQISFEINTGTYTGKIYTYDTEIGKDRIKGTDVSIRQIVLDPYIAEIFISYEQGKEPSKPNKKLEPLLPAWFAQGQDAAEKQANLLIVRDEDFQPYNSGLWAYGAECHPGEGLRIKLAREFWNSSRKIYLRLQNLTYIYEIGRNIEIKLVE